MGYNHGKGHQKGLSIIMDRPLCNKCKKNLAAINYYKDDRVFYRSVCDSCARGVTVRTPRWSSAGYKKKSKCDKCGLSHSDSIVFDVYHVDGNLNNCLRDNLKTVCANCQRLLVKQGLGWRQGDLTPDF